MREILTFILAGGKGERLNPLTRDRAKPAVPFGGIYRIIDFTLSNCINSGLRRVYVLIQYKSFSLQKHILSGWDIVSSQLGEFIDVIPPQQRISSDWYKGTADAIYQNSYAIQDHQPDLVMVLAGDHIYKMNYQHMIKFHKEMDADMTVACLEMPKESSVHFGVIEVNPMGNVLGFQEKPQNPRTIPHDETKIFASMGIYLFKADILKKVLETDAKNPFSEHDFGKNIIPQMLKNQQRVFAFNFVDENGKPKYWRDIGTRDAYYEANMDLVKPKPEFDLYDKSWPVRTFHEQYPPIKIINSTETNDTDHGFIINSIISGGCVMTRGEIKNSVLSSNVRVENHSKITNSILMESVVVGENSRIKNAIIDKEVVLPPNSEIGYNLDLDRRRFDVTTSGIVIVAKKTSVA